MTLNNLVLNAIFTSSPAERARESEKHAEQQNSFVFN